MNVFGALFQFGKRTNGRAGWLIEGVVHFQQQRMVTLDNQGVVWLKAVRVVHEPASSLCSSRCVVRVCVCDQAAPMGRGRTQEYARKEHGVAYRCRLLS